MNSRNFGRRFGVFNLYPCLIAATLVAVAEPTAQAQGDVPEPLPTATLLSTSGTSPNDAALDSAIHASLERLGVVTVAVRPGLDLRAVQLAIGCTGESARCLRAVTAQSDVQILIAPSLRREEGALSLSILYFDARNEHDLRHVERQQDGEELLSETLDAIPSMLRELFRLPSARGASQDGTGQGSATAGSGSSRPSLVAPVLVTGTGLLALGGGIVAGLMMRSNEQDYQALRITTPAQVDAAIHKRSLAKDEAVVANVLYGVGAGAIAIGGVWLAIALTHRSGQAVEPQTALMPVVGRGHLGLTLIQRGPAL
jgi:hypothetical protein